MERSLNSEACPIGKGSEERYCINIRKFLGDEHLDSGKCQLFDMLPKI